MNFKRKAVKRENKEKEQKKFFLAISFSIKFKVYYNKEMKKKVLHATFCLQLFQALNSRSLWSVCKICNSRQYHLILILLYEKWYPVNLKYYFSHLKIFHSKCHGKCLPQCLRVYLEQSSVLFTNNKWSNTY